MNYKSLDDLDEMPRGKLIEYIEDLQDGVDRAQRELADSVRDELDLKFSYDALLKKYNIMITEIRSLLEETYGVDRETSWQVVRDLDNHAAQQAATYPRGGCSG